MKLSACNPRLRYKTIINQGWDSKKMAEETLEIIIEKSKQLPVESRCYGDLLTLLAQDPKTHFYQVQQHLVRCHAEVIVDDISVRLRSEQACTLAFIQALHLSCHSSFEKKTLFDAWCSNGIAQLVQPSSEAYFRKQLIREESQLLNSLLQLHYITYYLLRNKKEIDKDAFKEGYDLFEQVLSSLLKAAPWLVGEYLKTSFGLLEIIKLSSDLLGKSSDFDELRNYGYDATLNGFSEEISYFLKNNWLKKLIRSENKSEEIEKKRNELLIKVMLTYSLKQMIDGSIEKELLLDDKAAIWDRLLSKLKQTIRLDLTREVLLEGISWADACLTDQIGNCAAFFFATRFIADHYEDPNQTIICLGERISAFCDAHLLSKKVLALIDKILLYHSELNARKVVQREHSLEWYIQKKKEEGKNNYRLKLTDYLAISRVGEYLTLNEKEKADYEKQFHYALLKRCERILGENGFNRIIFHSYFSLEHLDEQLNCDYKSSNSYFYSVSVLLWGKHKSITATCWDTYLEKFFGTWSGAMSKKEMREIIFYEVSEGMPLLKLLNYEFSASTYVLDEAFYGETDFLEESFSLSDGSEFFSKRLDQTLKVIQSLGKDTAYSRSWIQRIKQIAWACARNKLLATIPDCFQNLELYKTCKIDNRYFDLGCFFENSYTGFNFYKFYYGREFFPITDLPELVPLDQHLEFFYKRLKDAVVQLKSSILVCDTHYAFEPFKNLDPMTINAADRVQDERCEQYFTKHIQETIQTSLIETFNLEFGEMGSNQEFQFLNEDIRNNDWRTLFLKLNHKILSKRERKRWFRHIIKTIHTDKQISLTSSILSPLVNFITEHKNAIIEALDGIIDLLKYSVSFYPSVKRRVFDCYAKKWNEPDDESKYQWLAKETNKPFELVKSLAVRFRTIREKVDIEEIIQRIETDFSATHVLDLLTHYETYITFSKELVKIHIENNLDEIKEEIRLIFQKVGHALLIWHEKQHKNFVPTQSEEALLEEQKITQKHLHYMAVSNCLFSLFSGKSEKLDQLKNQLNQYKKDWSQRSWNFLKPFKPPTHFNYLDYLFQMIHLWYELWRQENWYDKDDYQVSPLIASVYKDFFKEFLAKQTERNVLFESLKFNLILFENISYLPHGKRIHDQLKSSYNCFFNQSNSLYQENTDSLRLLLLAHTIFYGSVHDPKDLASKQSVLSEPEKLVNQLQHDLSLYQPLLKNEESALFFKERINHLFFKSGKNFESLQKLDTFIKERKTGEDRGLQKKLSIKPTEKTGSFFNSLTSLFFLSCFISIFIASLLFLGFTLYFAVICQSIVMLGMVLCSFASSFKVDLLHVGDDESGNKDLLELTNVTARAI